MALNRTSADVERLEQELRDLPAHPPELPESIKRAWIAGVPANELRPLIDAHAERTKGHQQRIREIRSLLR
ncbi:MAG TPA: hypothetical protein VE987_15695 [Polyangiaceae bacterium]|nr:hypothetical protein [Polyangiaceae bacterium]